MKLVMLFFILNLGASAQGLFDLKPHRPTQNFKQLSDPDHWMVIIGDSGATGVASNLKIEPNLKNLLPKALDYILTPRMTSFVPPLSDFPNPSRFHMQSVLPMRRVNYSMKEFEEAKADGDEVTLNSQTKTALALDIQEHGNGYMIGRGLDIAASDIVLVGKDGVRVESLPIQFARIYELQTETLPPFIVMSFTANDFCDQEVFTESIGDRKARFAKNLAQSFELSKPYLKAHARGTKIVVLAPIEVANVLTNKSVMEQVTDFQGAGKITCGDVREGRIGDGFLSELTAKSLGNMCKAVLLTKPSDTGRIERLREIQNSFNDVWKQQIETLNSQYRGQGIGWTYVEGIRNLQFQKGDLAKDCFHPGVGGHAKMADLVLREVFQK